MANFEKSSALPLFHLETSWLCGFIQSLLFNALIVGAGARCADGAQCFGQVHPANGPSQKGTGQQNWHQENSQENGYLFSLL